MGYLTNPFLSAPLTSPRSNLSPYLICYLKTSYPTSPLYPQLTSNLTSIHFS